MNVEDCLSKRQLPKMDDHTNHIFVLFHFPIQAKSRSGIGSGQVSFFVGSNFLISVHDTNMSTVTKLFDACQQDPKHQSAFMKSSARLLYQILDALVDDLFPFLQNIEESLGEISDRVFGAKKSVAAQLSFQRRTIVDLRRMVSPMRRLATDLALKSQRFSNKKIFPSTSAMS